MLETEETAAKPSAAAAPAARGSDGEDDLPFGFNDLRDKIPVLGLKEYWYPALQDKRVGWRKPVFLKMLGEDLCLFRGKSGKVAALANSCPHRGAMLAHGNCEFRGHVACFYHGFVFDERGQCVAALGEGPQSPMPGKISARVYPTETRKGVVFVWMGKGAPVPLEDAIPEEFFDPAMTVLSWHTEWPANWRPCFENSFDSARALSAPQLGDAADEADLSAALSAGAAEADRQGAAGADPQHPRKGRRRPGIFPGPRCHVAAASVAPVMDVALRHPARALHEGDALSRER